MAGVGQLASAVGEAYTRNDRLNEENKQRAQEEFAERHAANEAAIQRMHENMDRKEGYLDDKDTREEKVKRGLDDKESRLAAAKERVHSMAGSGDKEAQKRAFMASHPSLNPEAARQSRRAAAREAVIRSTTDVL